MALCLTFVIFAGYSFANSLILKDADVKKTALEQELKSLEEQKQALITENEALKNSVSDKDIQISDLADMNNANTEELNKLYERENVIRMQLGLEPLEHKDKSKEQLLDLNAVNTATVISLDYSNPSLEAISTDKRAFEELGADISNHLSNYDTYESIIQSEKYKQEQKDKEEAEFRNSARDLAKQFIGGEYQYGGNNPGNGVDCSGFSSYILRNSLGISLNRTAAAQSTQGRELSDISEAAPGDLIFYTGSGGSVNHVAVYVGDGKVVHASNEENGIMMSNWNYRTPYAIKDMLYKYY